MRLCLDTSAYSAFKRGDETVLRILRRAAEIVLPAVALGELRAGFRAGTRERRNLEELEAFLDSPRVGTASIDEETAIRYADIVSYLRSEGSPIPTNDIWIAASAMQWGLRILTRDAHFARLPQVSVEPLPPRS